ncbi:tigger transposable element-derived protein 1-like [Macrobrachium rosenbergii]|uniref:tigger transposable element-derived protein 1-like n=1 Tax=Macrobrachium rosenbergii TaxID=79674 RepID=UPI0034D53A9B
MDETGLFWKKMPSQAFIMKDKARAPSYKSQEDRVTLTMCGNAAGFMMKPGLIYKSANPRALKNKNTHMLPVFWMHNAKVWITKVLTDHWCHQSFIPQVNEYLSNLGMEFKVLLIMDNAGSHPVDLYYYGVQLEFLPANTTSLLQPSGRDLCLQGTLHLELPRTPCEGNG